MPYKILALKPAALAQTNTANKHSLWDKKTSEPSYMQGSMANKKLP
jgi:hypothetical protein